MTKLVKPTIVVSVALTAVLGALTLMQAPPRVVRVSARGEETIGTVTGSVGACQAGEVLPAGVSAVRLSLAAEFGPPVLVRAYLGSRIVAEGTRGAGWTASAVTVPVRPLRRTASSVKLCFQAQPNSEQLQLYGVRTAASQAAIGRNGQPLAGRMTAEYLATGHGSWWSRVLPVARHMGIGHALAGSWLALLVAAAMAGVCALVVGLAWRELPSSREGQR